MESLNPESTTIKLEDVKPRGDLFPQQKMEEIFCKYDFSSPAKEAKICHFGSVPMINGIYRAYAHHFPLSFCPDDFWLLILQGFCNHVNLNAENLRQYFVDFEGKKKLSVSIDKFTKAQLTIEDYKYFINQLIENRIPEYVNKDLIEAMKHDFSTSTDDCKYVGGLSIMNCFKKYFNYELRLSGCGIPSVTLRGSVEDWEKLLKKMEFLEKYDMKWWFKDLKPTVKKIVESRKGKVDVEFWKGIIKKNTEKRKVYGNSGIYEGQKKVDFITGWILKFFPYTQFKVKFNAGKIDVANVDKVLPSQMLEIPYTIREFTGNEIDMLFYAGFLGMNQDKETKTVSPCIGWFTREGKSEEEE